MFQIVALVTCVSYDTLSHLIICLFSCLGAFTDVFNFCKVSLITFVTHVLTVYNTSSVSLHTVKIVCIEVCEVNFRAREMVSKFCSFLIHMLSSEGFCCCCLCFICGVRLKLRFSFFVYTSPSAPAPFLYLTVFFH